MIMADELDRPLAKRSRSSQSSHTPPGLLSLPDEILEQVYLLLRFNDRLRLRLVCKALQNVYESSALLQYKSTLETTGYLDIPYRPSSSLPPSHPSQDQDSPNDSIGPSSPEDPSNPSVISLKSPHTGKPRQTVPSVSLAPWPKEPSIHIPHDTIISPADRNKLLEERENRWETLDWGEKRTFKVQGREGVYELQEGIFLMCDDFNDVEDDKPSSIRLIPLPSMQDPDLEDPPIQTTSHKVDFPISDLTMDPTQDLIVVSEYRPAPSDIIHSPPTHRYHLLTLSTMKPHPLANSPTLDFPPFSQAIMDTRQLLQVMGDTLVVQVSRFAPAWVLAGLGFGIGALGGLGHEEEMVAWNWKTGKVLSRISLPENGWFSSFALLTPTTFLVTSTSNISPVLPSETRSVGSIFPPVIQIYSFLPDPNNPIDPVQPLDTDPMDDTTPRPVLLAQLQLPPFAEDVSIHAFDVRPDPAFPPNTGPGPTLGKTKPFTQNPSKGVMVFELKVVGNSENENIPIRDRKRSYEIFILRETLVDFAVRGEERLKEAYANGGDFDGLGIRGVERNVPWSEWGEENTRFMDAVMKRRSWVCSCSGYRFVSLIPAIRPPNHGLWPSSEDPNLGDAEDETHEIIPPPKRSDLMIFDFSPSNLRRSISTEEEPMNSFDYAKKDWSVKIRDGESIMPRENVWKNDVHSRLTFREIRREYGGWGNGVMCDDQRVIVVHTQARRNGDWSTISQEMSVLCM
ncbi:hypothetical protein I302_105743 [Kwoniella bestiolae CBS 10118]|uniref:F-box domain-containing protein n=1 Tax=Kwoniella bestiolae CBS 10118 TaxID=1296100 RepID=A0A1B9G206_9TREE|nr:hypothetical protein I302_04863 [Kwoniella bestiolae CBS 10118]OCF25053.1 hypothetical protein I302_04863 [Kwoniella bestiolae CBS 10118]